MNETTRTSGVQTMGRLCLAAGLLGAASGVLLAVVPAQVPVERFSYPFDVAGFAAIQIWFLVQHLGLIAGLLALGRSGALGGGRMGRIGNGLAVVGLAVLAVTEVAAIGAADDYLSDPYVGVLNIAYGVSMMLCGVGLVLAGIAAVRVRMLTGVARYLPLIIGIWVFVPMTPAIGGPFLVARAAITSWMLLFAALGWVLARQERPSEAALVVAETGSAVPDGVR